MSSGNLRKKENAAHPGRAVRISAAIGAAAGAAAVSACLTTKFLMKVALDREVPRGLEKAGSLLSGARKDDAFLKSLERAGAELAAQENETVTITARDGVELAGHYIPCRHPRRIIIAMHGWRSSWYKDFGMMADFWEKEQCSVLYAEQRGQNNSGGDYMGFGLTERYDVLEWIRWVTERCGTQIPIYLAGVSMGATTVLMAAGLDLPDNVRGIAGDCGFTSPQAIWKHVANQNLHMTFGLRGIMADSMFRQRLQLSDSRESTVEALKACRTPVLLIHGTEDHFVPVEMTYENYKACAGPKKLFIVPGADHGMSYFIDPKGYEAVIREFWKRYD